MHRACYRNRHKIVELLVSRGANLELSKQPKKLKHAHPILFTPLYFACMKNRRETIECLLDAGA